VTDKLTPERRSENMSRIRSRDTSPELIVRRLVHAMGYRFRLHVASLPGKPDIVLPRLKSIIEVRGCFWHQHSGCIDSHIPKSRRGYWKPKLDRNCTRDRVNGRELRRLGWRICVIWECEAKNPAKISRRIARFLEAKRNAIPLGPSRDSRLGGNHGRLRQSCSGSGA
jgi:DNA mismatch endonuclease, patch repair protein